MLKNNIFLSNIVVRIFQFCGSLLFENRTDFYIDGKFVGVGYSNNHNIIIKFGEMIEKLNEQYGGKNV